MRRTYLVLGLVAAIGVGTLAWSTSRTTAEPSNNSARRSDQPATPALPLTSVVLFNSGVGYFQREGTVDGDTRIDMQFRVGDVNDLLKSLVLQDVDQGRVSAVSYDSQEPVEKTLKSFALDLTYNPTVGQLLNQARGEKVEITLQQTAAGQPAQITGKIMGMESRNVPQGKDAVVEMDQLNLACAEGIRSVPLSQVQRLRFLNANIDSEFHRALEVLAASHDSQKRSVSLNFKGEGKRRVKVGYVVENPMWKASYRLVLGDAKKNGPLMQGWALIENTSDEDWKDVRVALISGRPISFQMDLYQPLFIPRPTVEPERFASLRPPTYSGALAGNPVVPGMGMAVNPGQQFGVGGLGVGALGVGGVGNLGANFGVQGGNYAGMNPLVNRYQMMQAMGQFGQWGNLGGQAGLQGGNASGQDDPNVSQTNLGNFNNRLTFEQLQQRRNEQRNRARSVGSAVSALDPSGGVSSVATAEEIGDYFQYSIDERVTLPRQKSAMLPVVNKAVEGRRVSIYNEAVHAKFPLLGLRFKNTTGQHLVQGPVSVFDNGVYAGDSRVMDLQPDEERLISYAIDLGSEVKTEQESRPEQLIALKVFKGVLLSSHKLRETKTYHVINRSKHDRVMVLEHPVRDDWKLVEPAKASERSREVYRFEVNVPAGKSVEHKVVEEQTRQTRAALNGTDDRLLRFFLVSRVVGDKVKESLARAMTLKGALDTVRRDLAQGEKQLKAINDDQARLRANFEKLPPTSAAYKRYLEKFDKQETEVEKLQARIAELQEAEKKSLKDYEDYLAGLTVE